MLVVLVLAGLGGYTGLGLSGAYPGREVGSSMNPEDWLLHDKAVIKSVVWGSDELWENPRTGNRGHIEPGQRHFSLSWYWYCREYEDYITIGGKQIWTVGAACKRLDGSWRIVN